MDAILFSVNKKLAIVDDAIRHLDYHSELYWSSTVKIIHNKFHYPILGYMHINGKQVEYVATINRIIPFTSRHYEDEELSSRVTPVVWVKGWRENVDMCKSRKWKCILVITKIEPFSYDTRQFEKYRGGKVSWPPQNYIQVFPPMAADGFFVSPSKAISKSLDLKD